MIDGQRGYCAKCGPTTIRRFPLLGENVTPDHMFACGKCETLVVFSNEQEHDEWAEGTELST